MRLTLNSKPVCHLFGQKNALPVKGGQFSLEENKFLSGRFLTCRHPDTAIYSAWERLSSGPSDAAIARCLDLGADRIGASTLIKTTGRHAEICFAAHFGLRNDHFVFAKLREVFGINAPSPLCTRFAREGPELNKVVASHCTPNDHPAKQRQVLLHQRRSLSPRL